MNRIDELQKKINPVLSPYMKYVAVFGSYARGEETSESDIDLLVEPKPADERLPLGLKWFALEAELSQSLGREVEMVAVDNLSPYLRPYIEQDKVILYEEE